MDRREVLRLISLSALAPAFPRFASAEACASAHAAVAHQPYNLRFFTPKENSLLDELMELIIPADAHSPGARAAKVSLFADWMVDNSGGHTQVQWRSGLRLVKRKAAKSSIAKTLSEAAANEEHPVSELDHFFIALKQMTVDGYYTSEIGIHQDMDYQGNEYLLKFPGCTHPEHKGE